MSKKVTGQKCDPEFSKVYKQSLKRLEELQKLEDLIELAPEPALLEYYGYIDRELESTLRNLVITFAKKPLISFSGGDPCRIQLIFERAITKNCLEQGLWLKYLTWLDTDFKNHQVGYYQVFKVRLRKT